MPALSVRDIPEPVYARLKERAALNRRSVNAEVVLILEQATRSRRLPAETLLARIDRAREGMDLPVLTDEFLSAAKAEGRP